MTKLKIFFTNTLEIIPRFNIANKNFCCQGHFNSLSASHISNTEAPYTRLFSNGLAIACLNINSLLAHIDDLRILWTIVKSIIKLDSSISNSEIHLSGYDVVRLDRKVNGRSGGGVCMYIRSNLNFRIREDLANDLEILIIEISNPRSKPFLVGTWYRPPSSSQQLFTLFKEIIDKIFHTHLVALF